MTITTPETTEASTAAGAPEAQATATPAAPTRTLGIVSLALGVASIVTGFQFFIGAAAIVVGILALRQEAASGKFAIWGIITGAVSTMGTLWALVGAAFFLPLLGLAGLASWGYWGW